MTTYQAPVRDMLFVLRDVLQSDKQWYAHKILDENMDFESVTGILEECARFAAVELHPLNRSADREGLVFKDGSVSTPAGFKEAYHAWVSGGWVGLAGDPAYGGMGLPKALAMLTGEMLFAANSAFALYPELTGGATYLISLYADKNIKKNYLPHLYSGKWSATMCLTESHCGSDLGLLRTQARKKDDNSYEITGEKIFISGGDHDLTENIIHLVLARLPEAPSGVKGISLFLVPKYLSDTEETGSQKNTVTCSGIEEKMGIKAAATCVMHFDGARGFLIGEANQGLVAMFSMMNYERLSIAMQGLGAGDASYQTALAYAKQRIQGKSNRSTVRESVPIIAHGDVRRMLLTMKALNEAGRMFSCYAAAYFDQARYTDCAESRNRAMKRVALLTPVVKAFLTDRGFEVCILGQQVLGGHGYICEWGQEQLVRDVRIAQIYEGTNGIQALDFLLRRVIADKGKECFIFIDEIKGFLAQCENMELKQMKEHLSEAVELSVSVTQHMINKVKASDEQANAVAVEYLQLFGYVAYAYMWLKMAKTAVDRLKQNKQEKGFFEAKVVTAKFYFHKILPVIHGLAKTILGDEGVVYTLDENLF